MSGLFQSTLPGRGATSATDSPSSSADFNPRSPEGSDRSGAIIPCRSTYFNPRSPGGERLLHHRRGLRNLLFQSTLPGRGATSSIYTDAHAALFQSTLPGRGATKRHTKEINALKFQSTLPGRGATTGISLVELLDLISIHAPREGSDASGASLCPGHRYFNPRSPGGERHHQTFLPAASHLFQSTLPGRGATSLWRVGQYDNEFQSTLPGRGATLIHDKGIGTKRFQSTLPGRGATPYASTNFLHAKISIHAPREGSDPNGLNGSRSASNFNPRSPGGERPYFLGKAGLSKIFQSTLPGRGATAAVNGTM